MIEPEVASRWRSQAAHDRMASVLIGIVAILAAIFAIEQAHSSLAGTRAAEQGARLAADAAAQIAASSTVESAGYLAQQDSLVMGMEAVSRQLQGTIVGDETAVAVGAAQMAAVAPLNAALAETAATSGGEPLDAYAARLVTATNDEIVKEVKEQNRQVDLANAAGSRELASVLGLSLVALTGVLAGISAVMGRGRAGWLMLAIAWVVAGVSAVLAVSPLV